MTEKLTGSEIVIKELVDAGIDTIFGYPGGAVLPATKHSAGRGGCALLSPGSLTTPVVLTANWKFC